MIKVILCIFNEEKNLKTLIPDINKKLSSLKLNYEIYACIDGSTDSSLQILQDYQNHYPIQIIEPKNQRGLGLAFKRSFQEVIKNCDENDLLVTLDADNTHDINQIETMIHQFHNYNLDVLVNSRFANSSIIKQFPLHRKLISKTVSLLLQSLFPIKKVSLLPLQDYTSGYRIYRAKKIYQLIELQGNNFISEPEFTYTCEILIKLSRIKSKIDEHSISYDYGRKYSKSKLKIIPNFIRLLIMIKNLR